MSSKMDVVRKNDVGKIEDGVCKILSSLEGSTDSWFLIHFSFSKISDENHTHELMDTTINVIKENLSQATGKIFLSPDADIFLICKGVSEEDVKRLMQDIGYSYEDDPGLRNEKGEKIPFAIHFPVPANINDALEHCNAKLQAITEVPGSTLSIDKYEFKSALEKRDKRRRLQILVVEDDAFSRQLISKAIHHTYEIVTAADGEQAIKMYEEDAPNITFLDIGLPKLNGLEVLKSIMKVDANAAYVVMLTANTEEDKVKEAIENGAKGYIAKPFTKAKIEHYLENFKSAEKMQWGRYGSNE